MDTPSGVGGVLSLRAVKLGGTREDNPHISCVRGLRVPEGGGLCLWVEQGTSLVWFWAFRQVLMLFHIGLEVTISGILYLGSYLSSLKTQISTL